MAKKTAKKKAAKKTNKPSAGWVDKPDPIEVVGKAKATKKAKAVKKAPVKKVVEVDDEGTPISKIPVPLKYREAYKEHSGSCGDNMSKILKESDIPVVEIGDANGINVMERWGHLNNGMQRMNLGNMLRGKVKKGESVKIGSKTIKGDK